MPGESSNAGWRCGQNEPAGGMKELVAASHAVARQVLPFLSQKAIPITPPNYRLWYEYFAGSWPELRETLDGLLSDGLEFTPDLTNSLYHRFFSIEASDDRLKILNRTEEKVQKMALEIIKGLLISISHSTDFSQSLGRYLSVIEEAQDLETLKEVVGRILVESNRVIKAHETFHGQMKETSENLRQLEEDLRRAEELANTDELTGLPNRRALNRRLIEEECRAKRYNAPLSFILFDLDDFKKVNDSFGHLVGDRLLAITAKAVKAVVRLCDMPARFGGEEFAVICPQTDLSGAVNLANRLRVSIEETTFTVKGAVVKATISGGAAMYRFGETVNDLIDRADQALLLAKKRGKNLVVSESDLPAGPVRDGRL